MSGAPPLAWDYTQVARAYLKRPAYAPAAIDALVRHAALAPASVVADVGAGTGNLALPLLERGLRVVAIEPNEAMRRLGEARTATQAHVRWTAARAEAMLLPDRSCDAVTFGSSFNVVDRLRAVVECGRVVRPGGWIACVWNHRRLDDPLQAAIEGAIRERVPGYSHGSRRADPSGALEAGGLFGDVHAIAAGVVHEVCRADFLEAWRSHLTLRRQAGAGFPAVLDAIDRVVAARAPAVIEVPYVTRAWLARRRQDGDPRRPRGSTMARNSRPRSAGTGAGHAGST